MEIVKGLDLGGLTYVITGGDEGMGFETALSLASVKAKVILACRSRTKCLAAVTNITQATGNKHVSVIPLDLSSFDSVRICAAAIREQVSRIDVLVNNAALETSPKGLPSETDDGFDRVYEVNFLSSYLLVQELLPLLRDSGSRVVNVVSAASFVPCIWGDYFPSFCKSLRNLPKFAKRSPSGLGLLGVPASNYGMTKYLDVFITAELARREPNITAFSLHPGLVLTDMTSSASGFIVRLWCALSGQKPCPRTPGEGATTQTYLAVAPKEELTNGKYFDSCKVHKSVRDEYVEKHGENNTLLYQSAIYDMASTLIGPSERVANDNESFVV